MVIFQVGEINSMLDMFFFPEESIRGFFLNVVKKIGVILQLRMRFSGLDSGRVLFRNKLVQASKQASNPLKNFKALHILEDLETLSLYDTSQGRTCLQSSFLLAVNFVEE